MKPTIAAMAAKSGFDVSADGRFGNHSDMYKLEKFAALIIDQCCKIVDDAVNHREPASSYTDKIVHHFTET